MAILCMHMHSSTPGLRSTVLSLSKEGLILPIQRTLEPLPLHAEMRAGQAVTNGLSMIENLAVAQLKKYRVPMRKSPKMTKMSM